MQEIELMKEFIESYYSNELIENIRLNKKRLSIDFKDLQYFPELAEMALDDPKEFLRIGENAILELNADARKFIIRIKHIPESSKMRIRDIKSKYIDKLKTIEGYVTYKSDIRPIIASAQFECPSCSNVINIIQLEKDFVEPTKCSCGRRARFRIVKKEHIDAFTMVIEEIPETIKYGSELKKMNVLVKKDLCHEDIEEKIIQGSKLQITGVIKEAWKITAKKKQTQLDIYFEANYIQLLDISFYDFKITPQDEKEIIAFSEQYKDPIKKICKDVFSGVYGYEKEKEIIVLQAIGGTTNISTKPIDRGNIHVLFVGEPGTGKSALLEVAFLLLPKVRKTSGKSTTGVGLIGAMVQDQLMGGHHFEIGALPLSHMGTCLAKDTEIPTNQGIKKINEINKGDVVYSFNNFKIVESKVININKRMANDYYILKFRSGDKLTITTEHQLPVWDNKVNWKRVRDLKKKEFVISPRELPNNHNRIKTIDYLDMLWVDNSSILKYITQSSESITKIFNYLNIPRSRSFPGNNIKIEDVNNIKQYLNINYEPKIKNIPENIDDNMLELVGLIASDGHLTKKKYSINFYNTNEELIDRFIQLSKLIGIDNYNRVKEIRGKYTSERVSYNCDWLHLLCQNLGIPKGNKSKTPFGNTLLNFPKELIKSFLIGFINGDGSISNRKGGGALTIINGTYETTELLRKLFRRLGIIGNVRKINYKGGGVVKKGEYIIYHLEITGINNIIRINDDRIVKHKSEQLRKIIIRKNLSDRIPKVDKLFIKIKNSIPYGLKKHLYKTIRTSTLSRLGLASNTILQAIKGLDKIPSVYKLDEYHTLKKIVNSNVYFNEIISIEKIEEDIEVYNLQVNMASEPNFIANNIFTHNCIIDELDKLPDEDKKALHNPMEQLELDINKGNVHLTLKCHTSILASANPKYGRFDNYLTKYEQIHFEDTLINRFDFVIPTEQSFDKQKEKEAALTILKRRKVKPDYDKLKFYQKYIAYVKNITPEWSDSAEDIVAEAYSELIGSGNKERKSIPITKRQLGSIIRIAEARAKSQLQNKIKREHIKYALEMMNYWLSKMSIDSETGLIDIDKIEIGVTASQRNKYTILRDIIKELQNLMKPVPMQSILEECHERSINENEFEENIARMMKLGDAFEPRSGFIQLI